MFFPCSSFTFNLLECCTTICLAGPDACLHYDQGGLAFWYQWCTFKLGSGVKGGWGRRGPHLAHPRCKSALQSAFVERAHWRGGAKAFQRLCVRELCLLPLRARNLYGGPVRELCWFYLEQTSSDAWLVKAMNYSSLKTIAIIAEAPSCGFWQVVALSCACAVGRVCLSSRPGTLSRSPRRRV